jgi:hypothetical protein
MSRVRDKKAASEGAESAAAKRIDGKTSKDGAKPESAAIAKKTVWRNPKREESANVWPHDADGASNISQTRRPVENAESKTLLLDFGDVFFLDSFCRRQ